MLRRALTLAALLSSACAEGQGDDATPADASARTDAGAIDATTDGGLGDSTVAEGGAIDASATDASATDATATDTGPVDAGCGAALPPGWPSAFVPLTHNPLLVPTAGAALQGADNVYAPDVHDAAGVRVMFYGAQGSDGHDRIYAAWSKTGMEWRKYPTDGNPQPALDRGASNHVNDPSVVRVGALWRMYYTDAATGEDDRIWLAESSSLQGFSKRREVLGPVAGTWEAAKVGRPSVLLEGGVYKLWYDGQTGGVRSVGYATSTDGVTFTRHPSNPVFLNAGAVDVKKVGSVYVMLREAGDGTYWATSNDGVCWKDRGKLFGLSGKPYDAFGQVTPFLDTDGTSVRAVWFGGASVSSWNKNRIAAAFPSTATIPAGAGCTACTTRGLSCSEACLAAKAGSAGTCGSPGSTATGSCCACSSDGCDACVAGGDCQAACVAAGKAGGFCGYPGSADPANCCACLD
jgi:hypothetical protein